MARVLSNGGNAYIKCATVPALTYPFTASVWVNLSSLSVTNPYVFLLDNVAVGGDFIGIFFDTATGKFSLIVANFNGTVFGILDFGPVISANTWYDLVFVGTSTNSRTGYANGANSATDTVSVSVGATQTALWVGTYDQTQLTTNTISGSLADLALWNVALTPGEVSALASGMRPNRVRPGALRLWLPLDGLASPEPDFSGGAFNGTLFNGPTLGAGPPVTLFTPRWPQFLGATAATPWKPVRELKRNWLTRRGWG